MPNDFIYFVFSAKCLILNKTYTLRNSLRHLLRHLFKTTNIYESKNVRFVCVERINCYFYVVNPCSSK